jgi:hypothetical protein
MARDESTEPVSPTMKDLFLPGLPVDRIRACYSAAPGNEIETGKLARPESSAALAANAFGLFLTSPADLPPLPGTEGWNWPASSVDLEVILRFPWSGGRHPCLDVVVDTSTAVIGIESKRYEPFRPKSKSTDPLSSAYWRPVWGDTMAGYERIRDDLHNGSTPFARLDAAQLLKHAFALRTEVHRCGSRRGKQPILLYLYAEPERWPDGSPVSRADIQAHRGEIGKFAAIVAGDEVAFRSCLYRRLLSSWSASANWEVRALAGAVTMRYAP